MTQAQLTIFDTDTLRQYESGLTVDADHMPKLQRYVEKRKYTLAASKEDSSSLTVDIGGIF